MMKIVIAKLMRITKEIRAATNQSWEGYWEEEIQQLLEQIRDRLEINEREREREREKPEVVTYKYSFLSL